MHAVILAGGQGTRLRPLTLARRKELIPLLNRPLLEYRLRNLRQHGISHVALACAQGTAEIEEHFGDGGTLGLQITYHYEERPLGSGRAVKEAARAAGAEGRIIVCNGDILTNVDLTAMIARHEETGATLTMSLAPVDDPWSYGVVAVDDDLRIHRFVEKPPQGAEPSNLINAGTWIWEPEVLERIPDDQSAVRDGYSERVLFPGLIEAGRRVQGFLEDLWVDVGSPERYLRAQRLLLSRSISPGADGTAIVCARGVTIDPTAGIHGLVLLGEGAVVEAYAVIVGPTVIGPRACVRTGATVDASALWEDARIGAGAVVAHSIIGANASVADTARLFDAVLADEARTERGATPLPGARVDPGATLARD